MAADDKLSTKLQAENDELNRRLEEAEETLRAIRSGEVDALVVSGPQGERIFTLEGAERPYRVLVESMNEGAATLAADGTVFYCNSRLAAMLRTPLERIIGTEFSSFVAPSDREVFAALLVKCQVKGCTGKIALMNGEEGYALPVQLSCNALEVAGSRGTSIVISDLTELTVDQVNALRTSEERLSLALTAARMGVWEWNVQTNALFWSPEVFGIFGVESFNGMLESFTNALHPDDADRILAAARQALAEKTTFSNEYRIIRHDGQVRWLSDLARPIYDEKGNPLRLIGTVWDITERKQAEDELRRSERQLAEAQRIAHLGSWQWDSISGKIAGSDEFYRIFGRPISSYDEFIETVHPDDREMVNKAVQDTLDRQSYFHLNHRIVRPDGTIRVIHCQGEAEINGDGTAGWFIGTVKDITKRKQMEVKLEFQRNELIARAAELEAANIELEAFNHSVSHDLRRPLTVINSYCQVVEELCGDKLDEECQVGIREIYESTLHMSRLIETLLVFSGVTRTEMQLEKIDLSKLAEDVAIDLKLAEPIHRVTFRIAEGITADGDAGLLRVVLDNLLGNAWKFTGKREETVIEFGVTELDGKPACYVRDNGPGFDMAYADKLFLPFQRLPGMDLEGHGIGLATVDRIVRRHGGRVWAESEPGNGATFYFTLPGGFGGAAGRRA